MEVKVTKGPEVHCWGCGCRTKSEFVFEGEFPGHSRFWWCLDCMIVARDAIDKEIQSVEKEIGRGGER